MSQKWCLLNSGRQARTDRELRDLYGENAIISRLGQFNLVHLDDPSLDEVDRRIQEFDPESLFEDDCPICQMLRHENCDVIYDSELDDCIECEQIQ